MQKQTWVIAGAICAIIGLGGSSLVARGAKPAPPKTPTKPKAAAPTSPSPRVERLHTEDGLVLVSITAKATAADLGVPAPGGAREVRSQVTRMQPPSGKGWTIATAQLTSTAPSATLVQFYRKALGQPEVRRATQNGVPLVALSRVRGPESIIVRILGPKAGTTAISLRRAVQGAPLKLEPPGPESPLKPPAAPTPQDINNAT